MYPVDGLIFDNDACYMNDNNMVGSVSIRKVVGAYRFEMRKRGYIKNICLRPDISGNLGLLERATDVFQSTRCLRPQFQQGPHTGRKMYFNPHDVLKPNFSRYPLTGRKSKQEKMIKPLGSTISWKILSFIIKRILK